MIIELCLKMYSDILLLLHRLKPDQYAECTQIECHFNCCLDQRAHELQKSVVTKTVFEKCVLFVPVSDFGVCHYQLDVCVCPVCSCSYQADKSLHNSGKGLFFS